MSEARHPATRRAVLTGAGAAALAPLVAGTATGEANLDAELVRLGITGTFACLDVARDRLMLANARRAGERLIPASTFKIANALIALETGVVADDKEMFRWDGKPRAFKSWEQDMTLRQAITASNVPVFQEIARRIGSKRYEEWLDKLDYGNGQVGSNAETFWLDGPLRISAIEQVSFLAPLALGQLKMSKRAQELAKDMLKIETRDGRTLYAKTGWCTSTAPDIGWWVGWIEARDRIDTFALNIDLPSPDDAPRRVATGKALLAKLGLY